MRTALLVVGVAPFLAASALAACGDFSADSPPSSGDDASTGDAAAGDDAPATSDALEDTTTPRDGDLDADGGAKNGLCADASHWICDDFDESLVVDAVQWPAEFIVNGSLHVQPQAGAPSPQNVLAATISDSSGRAQVEANRQTSTIGHVHCELDFLHSTGAGETQFVRIAVKGTNGDLTVELRAKSGGNFWYLLVTSPDDGGISLNASTDFALADATWVHLAVDIASATTAAGPLSAKVDGVERMVGDTFPPLTVITAPKKAQLDIGASAVSSSATWSAQYDNVVCDVTP